MGAALQGDVVNGNLARGERMRAIAFSAYGGPDVLTLIEVPKPQPGPGQLRVRVYRAGVQPADCRLRAGQIQARPSPLPLRLPQILGNEFAGVVDQLGAGVDEFAVGDTVLGWAVLSCYAEYVVVSPAQIVTKPPRMPWDTAGALSASGQAALYALQALNVGRGDTLLIHAAAGGVGSAAVQLARRRGATVIGTASSAHHDYLRELGAMPVAYDSDVVARVRLLAPRGIDAALDLIGGPAIAMSLALGVTHGRIATLADPAAAARFGVRGLRTRRSLAALDELVDLHGSGALRIHVRRRYALHEAAAAHRALETGHGRGKVVLAVADVDAD